MTAKRKPKRPATGSLEDRGARVVSVYRSRVLVEMSDELAAELFDAPLGDCARADGVEAALHEVEGIRSRDADLADSVLAANVVSMALEIASPFNSATSKSMCAKEQREHLSHLRALLPPEETSDELDELSHRRAQRRRDAQRAAGSSAAET